MEGLFREFDGSIVATEDDFSDAQYNLTIEVPSIDTGVEMRDNHLKNADFFDAEKYSTMTFKSTSSEKVSEGKYKVTGDLTFHGITKPVTLDVWHRGTVENPQSGDVISGFAISGDVKRSDYNLGPDFPEAVLIDKVVIDLDGDGSPMNGIQDNEFSARWRKMAQDIPTPKAVLVVSAHWLTRGTRITAMDFPQTIHDFGGFPQELFNVQYPAPGSLQLARETIDLVKTTSIEEDHDWGLDHGTWTVVRHMYPEADIPVLQLSIDHGKSARYHFELAKELTELRKKGVLIIGSGNMVHNLRMLACSSKV